MPLSGKMDLPEKFRAMKIGSRGIDINPRKIVGLRQHITAFGKVSFAAEVFEGGNLAEMKGRYRDIHVNFPVDQPGFILVADG